ncbi:hypothetical protein QJQ45_022504 [Haematococcus lacustris]|nr:hypothetical protein QJQ45_022504 [Haematococcus lacustris]
MGYAVWKTILDDDGSVCGQDRSRVTFNASAGVDYLVVVEGFLSTSCGVPAINVTSAPINIGSCSNPHIISLGLGSASWVPTTSTCNTTNSFPCLPSMDYTYRLPAFNATRSITIDTCVAGVDAWDTVLYVFPAQGGACTFCPSDALYDDQGSVCGQDGSRVTFDASAGVDYLVVVEGYTPSSCGVPAINVTSTPPNIISVARDYTYRLPAFNATRSITIDTCVAGVDAWDTVLYVFPAQGGACTFCPKTILDDDGSVCGQDRSRVTFNASAGVDYLVVVEGFLSTSCGVPAINVTSTFVQAPPNITSIGSCRNPHNISLGLGSASWVPTTSTCNTTNSSPCWQARDYTYRLPAFNATRIITIDTCVAGVDAWDTVLVVYPVQGGACTFCPVSSSLQVLGHRTPIMVLFRHGWLQSNALSNDQGSVCGQDRSRVTFNASAGVDYLVVVEGFLSTSCGVPAINVTSTLVQAPPNITYIGSCTNPHSMSLGLGSASWVPTTSTCNTTNSSPCLPSRDYTYRLPAFNATRSITIDTCVAGVDAWDTVLFVLTAQGGACTICPSNALFNDQGSVCGQDRSRVTFNASAGVDYLVVVEGYYTTSCGVPAINVTSTLVQAPPNITPIGSCTNPHNISLGQGSASWVPTTSTCNTTNSFLCSESKDYTYRLPAFNATRNITIDTCVAGVDAWGVFLFVLPARSGACASCSSDLLYDDQGSQCGQFWRSRVTFYAIPGVDYLVVLEGFFSTSCGVPAINVTSTLVQALPNITSIGSCSDPHNISLGLGSASWVPTISTCYMNNTFACRQAKDYTYRLPAFNAPRTITIDTCVAGVDAWNTVLHVFPPQGGACTFCPDRSRVTFTADAGVDYLVVVDGYYITSCGVPAINVTSTLVQAPPNITPIGSCTNPHSMSLGLGSASWVPTTSTCNTTNSFPCLPSRDYTYRLPAFNATRSITIDTCVAGALAWDTILYVFPAQGGACTLCPSNLLYNYQGRVCGLIWSYRVTFTAEAGVDYLVVVEGYYTTSCGVPAINVTSTLVQAPPNITSIGSCNDPHNISLGLGSASWVPTTSTCNTTNSFPCRQARDYTSFLRVAVWWLLNALLIAEVAMSNALYDDQGSVCGQDRSRVTFNASAGVDYLVVVEGYYDTSCGVPAINVTSTLVQAPPNITSIGSCNDPHNISLGLGSASWVPTTSTCNTTNSFPCLPSRDYTYRLPAFNATRSITIDTCVAGVNAWDTVLYVFPVQGGACTFCSVSSFLRVAVWWLLNALLIAEVAMLLTCVPIPLPSCHGWLQSNALYDDQGSVCGQDRSRVTFNASAGVDYLVVVEGYYDTSCGVPAINVTSAPINLGEISVTHVLCTSCTLTVRGAECVHAMRVATHTHVCNPYEQCCCTTTKVVCVVKDRSRVTFNASAGVDYLVVVEGYIPSFVSAI